MALALVTAAQLTAQEGHAGNSLADCSCRSASRRARFRSPAARASIRAHGTRVTSALTLAEAARAILRARASGQQSEANARAATRGLQVFARRCDIVRVTDDVLARVGRPFPVDPIRTLDAVHLATAEVLAEPPALVTIVTRDVRVRDNARALGYAVE